MPTWVSYVQALGPTFAAVVAAIIASVIQYRQWRLGQDKLRLDLFDRRARIYAAIYQGVMITDGNVERLRDKIAKLIDDSKDHPFLFTYKLSERIAVSQITLMLLSSKLNSFPINHSEVVGMINDYESSVGAFREEILGHLRFTN